MGVGVCAGALGGAGPSDLMGVLGAVAALAPSAEAAVFAFGFAFGFESIVQHLPFRGIDGLETHASQDSSNHVPSIFPSGLE